MSDKHSDKSCWSSIAAQSKAQATLGNQCNHPKQKMSQRAHPEGGGRRAHPVDQDPHTTESDKV